MAVNETINEITAPLEPDTIKAGSANRLKANIAIFVRFVFARKPRMVENIRHCKAIIPKLT